MNRISLLYLIGTFMLVACLVASNAYTMKQPGSAAQVGSSSSSMGTPASSSIISRIRDRASQINNPLSSKKKDDSSKPGWVPPAPDRERFSRETQTDLENTVAQARARREKLEARVQELKTSPAPGTDDEKKAVAKKIVQKESEATALAEKEKSIRDRIAQATAPIKIQQPDGTFKEIALRDWDNMTARERKEAAYRNLEKGSEEKKAAKESYMANLTAKEQREHKEHSQEKKLIAAGKVGALGTIGTIGATALISGGVAAIKAATDDDDKKSSSGQAQVQIFEGGAQATGSGVESGTFQPTGGTADSASTNAPSPSDAGFTAVSPID